MVPGCQGRNNPFPHCTFNRPEVDQSSFLSRSQPAKPFFLVQHSKWPFSFPLALSPLLHAGVGRDAFIESLKLSTLSTSPPCLVLWEWEDWCLLESQHLLLSSSGASTPASLATDLRTVPRWPRYDWNILRVVIYIGKLGFAVFVHVFPQRTLVSDYILYKIKNIQTIKAAPLVKGWEGWALLRIWDCGAHSVKTITLQGMRVRNQKQWALKDTVRDLTRAHKTPQGEWRGLAVCVTSCSSHSPWDEKQPSHWAHGHMAFYRASACCVQGFLIMQLSK